MLDLGRDRRHVEIFEDHYLSSLVDQSRENDEHDNIMVYVLSQSRLSTFPNQDGLWLREPIENASGFAMHWVHWFSYHDSSTGKGPPFIPALPKHRHGHQHAHTQTATRTNTQTNFLSLPLFLPPSLSLPRAHERR
jgi:hypothetical protein